MENPKEQKKTSENTNDSPPVAGAKPVTTGKAAKGMGSMPMIIGSIVVAVALVGGGVWYWMANQKAPLPMVKVGIALPFSGDVSGAGFGETKGIQMAKKDLAADNIELVQVDSKCDPTEAKKVMAELIAKKVVAIIGEGCSGASLAMLPQANQNKIPMVSASASSPSLSIADDFFFRVVPPDNYQAGFTARLFKEKGIIKVSVLYTNDDYGNKLAEKFKETHEALGGKVVSSAALAAGTTQVTKQVADLKAANPDAIYLIIDHTPTSIAILKQVRAVGVTAPFYGSDSSNSNAILGEAIKQSNGMIITSFSTGTQAFRQALANAYPSDELLYAAAEGYDAFKAIYKAVATGADTGEEVKAALMNVDFQGVSGRIKFNNEGEVTDQEHNYDLLIAKDGVFVPLSK